MKSLEDILVIDTETGGLTAGVHSLFSVGMVFMQVHSDHVDIKHCREVLIKHENYKVTAGALKVNNINIVEHEQKAFSPEDALKEIVNYMAHCGFGGKHKAVLLGHNVKFDISFLKDLFDKYDVFFQDDEEDYSPLWDRYVGHRHIDTCAVAKFMYHTRNVFNDISSSKDLFAFYKQEGINPDYGLHTALGDALRTAFAYKQMVDALRNCHGVMNRCLV